MKSRLTILILLINFGALAQDNVAMIIDRDGFTNIRESKSKKSPIVGQINSGEFFTYKGTLDDWWEINKTFDKEAGWVKVTGFVHKSRIQPLQALPDRDKRKLIKEVFDKELQILRAENWEERKRHHEPTFDMILGVATDYIIKAKDQELMRIFIETVKLDAGSADEMPSWKLGTIFIKHPDWTIEELKHVGLTTNLINRLDFGFENVVTESDSYLELKSRIEGLK